MFSFYLCLVHVIFQVVIINKYVIKYFTNICFFWNWLVNKKLMEQFVDVVSAAHLPALQA